MVPSKRDFRYFQNVLLLTTATALLSEVGGRVYGIVLLLPLQVS